MIGTTLEHYRITGKLGEGGMGEVYRARDTRLQRDIALKVLPPHVANDSERLRRFQQEAQATAALSHPNILVVYDVGLNDGTAYLVSELLEGETLRARLDAGPIPPRKAINYAAQIVKGLAAANEKRILHRDLKPENIFITNDGVVKILDFGLAKLQVSAASTSASATIAMDSQPGTVLGTAAYMSPEQARGATVDHRTDIFSFGCVLYEMLSGRRAFEGETSVETMHAVLKSEPTALPDTVPPALARIAARCLEKQPEERFQSARDLAFALEALSGTGESRPLPAAVAPARRKSWAMTAALTLLCLAVGAAIAWMLKQPAPARITKLSILPPPGTEFAHLQAGGAPALSPDGSSIAFVASQDAHRSLWIRPLNSTMARSLAGTEGAWGPFWSPDGRWIGFFSEGKLRKIEASGGPVQALANIPQDGIASASGAWNSDGVIVISTSVRSVLYRIPSGGGNLDPLTRLEKETSHIGPVFLPDGKRFIFHARTGPVTGSVYGASLDGKERKLLLSDVTRALYAPSSRRDEGYLLYVRGTSLYAHPFDAHSLTLTGEPQVLVDQVGTTTGGTLGDFSVSNNGVLSYRSADATKFSLVWVDRTGKRLPVPPIREARLNSPRLSADGKRIAFSLLPDVSSRIKVSDIWVHDLERNVSSRLTFGKETVYSPVWSPDGKKIAYGSYTGLYLRDATGGGSDELLFPYNNLIAPGDWSADGKFITFTRGGETRDVWILPLTGDRKAYPLLNSTFEEISAAFAPGKEPKWFAYDSTESGRSEIYLQTFPPGGGKWQVSNNGGLQPYWRGDARELYYVAPDFGMMAVDVQLDGSVRVGVPQKLFTITPFLISTGSYAVSSDGQRFAVIVGEEPKVGAITIVHNWEEELKH